MDRFMSGFGLSSFFSAPSSGAKPQANGVAEEKPKVMDSNIPNKPAKVSGQQGAWFNIKTWALFQDKGYLSRNRDAHCKYKAVMRLSSLYNGNSCMVRQHLYIETLYMHLQVISNNNINHAG